MELPQWWFEPDEDLDFVENEDEIESIKCKECKAILDYDRNHKDFYCEECDINYEHKPFEHLDFDKDY